MRKTQLTKVCLIAATAGVLSLANAEYYCNGQLKANGGVRFYPNRQIINNGSVRFYPNGQLVKNGSFVFHPNGQLVANGPLRFYPNGKMVNNGSVRFYPNGQIINSGSVCFNPDGSFMSVCPAVVKVKANAGNYIFALLVNLLGSQPLADDMELTYIEAKMQTEFTVNLSTGEVGDVFAWCF